MKLFLHISIVLLLLLNQNVQCFKGFSVRGLFIADDTKWCGAGNKASNCHDLGYNKGTDRCCREHDYCPYTYSSFTPNYNGYHHKSFIPLSHCECDNIFYDCLHNEPYKRGSYLVWESYSELNIKCFAYLPCHDNSTAYDNIWNMEKERDTGACHDGMKVAVFDTIFDYQSFMENVITIEQKWIIRHALETRVDTFMSLIKKKAPCTYVFPNNTQKIIQSFERFMKNEPKTSPETTTMTTTTTVKVDESKNLDDQNHVIFYGYKFSNEFMMMTLIGCGLLIPGLIFAVVMSILRIQKALNNYIFIKNNNISDI